MSKRSFSGISMDRYSRFKGGPSHASALSHCVRSMDARSLNLEERTASRAPRDLGMSLRGPYRCRKPGASNVVCAALAGVAARAMGAQAIPRVGRHELPHGQYLDAAGFS